jgi:hypothetical protein
MAGLLTISARALGRKKPLIPDYGFPLPPDFPPPDEPVTLRDLIACIVAEEVRAFEQRQEQRQLARILTEGEIEAGLARGRVDAGGRDRHQKVNAEEAVATALQAFEDGIYLVFLDDEEQKDLDRQVFLRTDSKLTFVRLVMLAGA